MPGNFLSTQHLVEFLAVVSNATAEEMAARNAAECAAQMLEAEFAAVVVADDVITTVGFHRGRAPVPEILQAVSMLRGSLAVPGIGDCLTALGRVVSDRPLTLLVARLPGEGFTVEETNLVGGMGRALDLTMGMIRTLQAERERHERSRCQAEENAELLRSLQDRQRLREQLSLIQRSISRHDPLPVIFEEIVSSARDLMGGEVALRLQRADGSGPSLVASSGRFVEDPPGAMASGDAAGQAVETDRVARRGDGPDGAEAMFGRVNVVAAPVHEGLAAVGALSVEGEPWRAGFDAEDEAILVAFADHVSLALNDARAVEQVRLARHDSLTGLASRGLFFEKVTQCLAGAKLKSSQVAVLFIDLDGFKLVNDTAGHGTGAHLLAEVGRRITHSLRASDGAARLGGDEFAVALSGHDCLSRATAVADRLIADLSAPYRIDGHQLYIGASIGIAISAGSDEAEDLMRDADVAMYQAKQRGRRCYSVFEPHMRAHFFQRVHAESELRSALDRGEVSLHYQPLVALGQGEIVAAEALLRWQHPERGFVPPLEFIPLGEEAGLMQTIGRWVLQEACGQAALWSVLGAPIALNVNVSASQLRQGTLADDVALVLAESGLPSHLLTLELTESLPLLDDASTRGGLDELKGLGVKFAIDDFGTGYSSLSYLHQFPLDFLKIDRSLICNIGNDPKALRLARAIICLGRSMGPKIVGEGIEEQVQGDVLRRAGCQLGQGCHFARPAGTLAFLEVLQAWGTMGATPVGESPTLAR